MQNDLLNRYPAIVDLKRLARKRIPHFAWEYLDSGTGNESCLSRNRKTFDAVTLTPRFMQGEFEPELATRLFGRRHTLPFGIAPIGLTGLMWPGAERLLSRAAAQAGIPYTLSTVATASPEEIGPLCGDAGWFQLYPPRREDIRRDLLKRAKLAGFNTLLVTVDVPTGSRRERQIRAGVSVPPKINVRTLYHCAMRPAWTMATLRAGQPRFQGLEKYLRAGDMQHMISFIGQEFGGTLDWDYLQAVRDEWEGPIILKGILDVEQAKQAVAVGVDGILVSNHGGRQFDGAPAALEVLPLIRSAVGEGVELLYDSGVSSGLDIARAIALGADFVLLGRAFMYAVVALGQAGVEHAINILHDDLNNNMIQLGCHRLDELRERLN